MKRRLFTKKGASTTTPAQQPLPQEASPSSNSLVLYHSLTELPLKNYIDGVVNGNLSAIIKTGVCKDEDLLVTAWSDINQQYTEAIGDHEHRLFLSLYKEINRLSIVIEEINMLVRTLEKYYAKQFGDELNRILATRFRFDVSDPDGYNADLQRCLNRSKGYKIQMDLKLSQFKAIQSKQKSPGQAPNHEYFQSVLITLGDHAGYRLDDSISVYEFCDRIKRLNKHLEELKK